MNTEAGLTQREPHYKVDSINRLHIRLYGEQFRCRKPEDTV